MSVKYRYPGAKPFSANEAEIFYGREEQIEYLLGNIIRHPLLVLYSKSGLGKSSLINAGLTPALKQNQGLLPFQIRFGAHQSQPVALPLEKARQELRHQSPILDRLYDETNKSLWYLLKAHQLHTEDFKGFLIVFDQFEELFTYPPEAIKEFALQLGEVLYTQIPDRFREGMEKLLHKESTAINPADMRQLHQPFMVRILIAIRSDRLALLDRLKPYLPNILEHTFELLPLTIEQAEDAILNPAYEDNGFVSPIFDYEDAAIEVMTNFLSHGQQQEIESFQLQILCEHIERHIVLQTQKRLITPQDIQNPQVILEDYYLRKIATLGDNYDQLAARRLIEEGLIFEEEQRRLSLYEGQIEKSFGVYKELLERLVDTHLIRAEPSLRGGYTYELSHDTLILPVLKAKKERLQEEATTKAAAEKRQREAELAIERRKRTRARIWAGVMTILSAIALLMFLYASNQYRKAELARNEAQQARDEAREKQEIAERALKERNEVMILQILQDVERLEEAGQNRLALLKLEEAFRIDSTNVTVIEMLANYKSNE